MGPGAGAKATELAYAYELGHRPARMGTANWRQNVGVMDAASLGAKQLTV